VKCPNKHPAGDMPCPLRHGRARATQHRLDWHSSTECGQPMLAVRYAGRLNRTQLVVPATGLPSQVRRGCTCMICNPIALIHKNMVICKLQPVNGRLPGAYWEITSGAAVPSSPILVTVTGAEQISLPPSVPQGSGHNSQAAGKLSLLANWQANQHYCQSRHATMPSTLERISAALNTHSP
jgi:hypothetical protein